MPAVPENLQRGPGRPRGQGRRTTTVQFTEKVYARLRKEADKAGRSVSEEVEQRVERSFNIIESHKLLREMLLEALPQNNALHAENIELRATLANIQEQLSVIVENAVAAAIMRVNNAR